MRGDDTIHTGTESLLGPKLGGSARPRYGLATANQILGPWDCTCVTGMAYAYDHLKTL